MSKAIDIIFENSPQLYCEIQEARRYNNIKSIGDYTASELLDIYLKWNGIIGYTDRIIAFFKAFDLDITEINTIRKD